MGKNLRIKERLVKAFIRVTAIVAIAAVVGVAALITVNARYSHALVNYGFSQGDIGKAMVSFTGTRAYMLAAIGYSDDSAVKTAQEEHDKMKAKFVDTYWPEVANTLTTKDEKTLYETLSKEIDNYWTIEAEVLKKGATSNTAQSIEAQKMNRDQLEPIYNDVYDQLLNLMNTNLMLDTCSSYCSGNRRFSSIFDKARYRNCQGNCRSAQRIKPETCNICQG